MEPGIITAMITAGAAILAAIITGIFKLVNNKSKKRNTSNQKIHGNGNIQAGNNIKIRGDVTINDETTNKRK